MSKNIKPGFFTMEDANIVSKASNIFEAKRHAHECILNFVKAHPKTEQKNIEDAQRMINSNATMKSLTIAIGNYVMAHPSEGLGVLK